MKRIYKHTSEVVLAVKKLRKGGRQLKQYLEKEWNIQLQPKVVKIQQKVIAYDTQYIISAFTYFGVSSLTENT